MKGTNQLVLNEETMCEIVQEWLERNSVYSDRGFGTHKVTTIQNVMGTSNEEFIVTLEPRKPEDDQ